MKYLIINVSAYQVVDNHLRFRLCPSIRRTQALQGMFHVKHHVALACEGVPVRGCEHPALRL
jgi:hypothetical protein